MAGDGAKTLANVHIFQGLDEAELKCLESRCRWRRVSTTRETAARALSQVYATDLLRRKGRNFYLMDMAKLEEFASALHYAETHRASAGA